MNDRFKFRVWDKEFKKYWTDGEIKENAAWLLFPDNDNIENIEIEQCTGLKDKNGKLIFEGDIVTDGKVVGRIYWYKIGWAATMFLWRLDPSKLEVIGNVHENERLLK